MESPFNCDKNSPLTIPNEIGDRKNEHLKICLSDPGVESGKKSNSEFSLPEEGKVTTGLEKYFFEYDSLPEIDFDEISLKTTFLGRELEAPLMIGAMTGGTAEAKEYNMKLAKAAEELGIAFALGSQRPMLKGASPESFDVKKHAPGLRVLLGNIGAVQLNYGVNLSQIQYLIESVQCDGFTFHLNPLQEAIQPEGDRNFKGLVAKLQEIIPQISVPVCIKEVGAGISRRAALKIRTLPVASIETAGVGGTSWAYIEAMRNQEETSKKTGMHLKSFGIPTSESIQICREIFPDKTVIGSGGIRKGLDVARAIALGADMVAFALPMLKEASNSYEDLLASIRQIIYEIKTIMFVTGCIRPRDLRDKIYYKG